MYKTKYVQKEREALQGSKCKEKTLFNMVAIYLKDLIQLESENRSK